MSVWYCIPSARPDGGTIPLWQAAGYSVAVWRDSGAGLIPGAMNLIGGYPGYAVAVNELVKAVFAADDFAEWIVTGGDDIEPDPKHDSEFIAAQCFEYFNGSFGVMQPTGDRWANGSIDRICGSPWIGHEFCERMYGGEGPLWSGWQHCYVDEELQNVAKRLGVLWQRQDLVHKHNHWQRVDGVEPMHLKDKNPTLHTDRPLFLQRQAAGFPGHEPIAV